jgi:serine/threonine-protein kinase HipA
MTKRCLHCYQPLAKDETDFHEKCSLRFFGTHHPPKLALSKKAMDKMANEIVIRSVAVTGVQPKLSLTIEKIPGDLKNSRITIVGALGGNFILKPQSPSFESLPENEDLTMHLAQIVGIKTAEHSLLRTTSGELVYLTKRFDRNKKEKLHCEDLCQLTETLTENKYSSSMEKVGKAVKKYATFPLLEAVSLYEITLFSFLTGNSDMHLKNFSILKEEKGNNTLAPCYDLLNTKLVNPKDLEESALTINGRKNKIKRSDFDAFGKNIGLNAKQMEAVHEKFRAKQKELLAFVKISFLSNGQSEEYTAMLKERGKMLR